ncbi:MAG: hypothetical protein ACI9TY_000589 [Alphaproteobacteria bacterium]
MIVLKLKFIKYTFYMIFYIQASNAQINTSSGDLIFQVSGQEVARLTSSGVLEVSESIKIGGGVATCDASKEGVIRYDDASKSLSFCNGTNWKEASAGSEYDISVFMPNVPNNNAIMRVTLPRTIRLEQNLPNVQCVAETAAAASTVVTLNKVVSGMPTSIGTLTWAAASKTCTASFSSDIDFAAGEQVGIAFPASADATLANIAITLAGIKL